MANRQFGGGGEMLGEKKRQGSPPDLCLPYMSKSFLGKQICELTVLIKT